MKKKIFMGFIGIVMSFCLLGCGNSGSDFSSEVESPNDAVETTVKEVGNSKKTKVENFITEIKTNEILFDNEVKTFKSDYENFDIIGYSTNEKLIKSLLEYFRGDRVITTDDMKHLEKISIVVPKMKIYYTHYTGIIDEYGNPIEQQEEMEGCYPLAFIYDDCERAYTGRINAFIYNNCIYSCDLSIWNNDGYLQRIENDGYYYTTQLEPFINAGVVEKPSTYVIE